MRNGRVSTQKNSPHSASSGPSLSPSLPSVGPNIVPVQTIEKEEVPDMDPKVLQSDRGWTQRTWAITDMDPKVSPKH